MGNRGQKRAETADELPPDKRTCSSLEFKPSSSGSSAQTPVNSTNLVPEDNGGDIDASSSNSESSQSDGEKDSAYGSCDSDEMTDAEQRQDAYQRGRSSGDHAKFKGVLSSLSEEIEQSQLAALTELCELLSFCMDGSLSSLMVDSLSPVLVKLSRHESNPDIILLAIRAITYLCDVHSRSSSYLVKHDAVPALCQRLRTIEYLDVAEQCLQALEKISREQPLPCLQSGAIMAVLNYIDFFSTSVQRVALNTVVNICKKLPSKCPPSLMEAVPVLCNLLQYEDGQLVENVANCLIKIVERVYHSSDILDELCKHGLVHQATHLIDLNSRTTLGPPVHSALIGLLVKLASGSIAAFRILFELNISKILKDILSTYDFSHGMPSHFMVDGNCNQVHEVLKLLNELLPAKAGDQDLQLNIDKKSFLVNQPDLLLKFAMDLLPVLIQVVNSGVSLYVCYGCLSVINKLVYFSNSDMLLELLKCTNISSFLAGVFTQKDHHVLILALQIVDSVLQKLTDVFLSSFIKEGILFAVDALVTPEKRSQFMFQKFNSIQLSNDQSQKSAERNVLRCLCCAFDSTQSLSTSASGTCKLENVSVHNLAKHIRSNYFDTELSNFKEGTTDILQKLKIISATLTDTVNFSMNSDASTYNEEKFYCILHQIMSQLNGSDPISTFEFLESGIVKSLLNYLSNGQCFEEKEDINGESSQLYIVEKRFEVLGRFLLSSSALMDDLFLSALIQKLQSALSSLENFPVMLSHVSKLRNSYATVPYGHSTSYPCLKVQFVRGEGESFLSDYTEEVFSVDPFSQLDAIAGYLWPKVTVRSATSQTLSHSLSESSSPECRSPYSMRSESMFPDLHEMKEDKPNLLQAESGVLATLGQTAGDTSMGEVHTDSGEQKQHTSSLEEDSNLMIVCSESCSCEGSSSNLLFYLDEQQLDHTLTLYQAILQQQIKAENTTLTTESLWSQAYKLTYRRVLKHKQGQVVAKALQDGRILDLPFSKAFYKLILGQDLTVYDIQSFDPGLGTALLEFQAIIERKKYLEFICGDKSTCKTESCFRDTRIEDLCLDFTLPGYPDFVTSGTDSKMVNMINLEEYVSLIVDATINSGISRQVEAFKLGFNQVFPVRHLQIFTEEELERLLCGECELWNLNELLDHIKFDHGYTASSPPVMNLLNIIREFDREQQKAFLRFVTGAPRLPRGGLASLNPKLTIVRKHCGEYADGDLPSVMTCANYLKLPPYSSKERMKEKLLYAITEGQGSFHLS